MRPKNIDKEDAIKRIALQIIAEEGLENLSMQKLAKAANISPRTIYLKYENKEDLLIRLFVDDVLSVYEQAVMAGFDEDMRFEDGVLLLWLNVFSFFKANRHAFALMQYGKSSPLLNKAFKERDIKEGHFFAPIHRFLLRYTEEGVIINLPFEAQRALLFAPVMDLVNEYFEHVDRQEQIITEEVLIACCAAVVRGVLARGS